MILNIVVHAVLIQTVPIGSGLSDGVHLVYESGGVEQAPWIYDSVRVVNRDGFDRCVIFTRRSQAPRESCARADTLFELGSAGVYVAARPLGPHMTLVVQTSAGNTMYYTTGEVRTRSVSGDADVQVIPTVIVTHDSTGATIRRLREDYAPSLLTALWGVFEAPEDAGEWSVVREFSLVGVSPADSAQAPAREPQVPPPTAPVVVEKDPGGEGWLATWHLASPARELRFERPAAGFRSRTFEVLTPGFTLERDGELEVLRTDGRARREIRVRFPEFDQQLPREYEFFRRFSDGGVAIYTGHLVVRPVSGGSERDYVRRFRFVPPEGAAVILAGERHDGAVEWTDASGRGTYVYVGAAAPLHSEDVISIVDPGLPAWVGERTRDALPRLFALYRDRLDADPPARPVVLFDYKAGQATGYSSGGGTLPGLIQLGAEGRAWETESRPALLQLLRFLAHEAAHVWNGEIAHYPGSEDGWMHEGGADALAERALLELGVIEQATFLDYQTNALNDCRAGLAATPLRPSARRGRPHLAYTCGNMIALLTEAVLLPGGMDLFDFWRALIAHASSGDGTYHAGDYLAVWRVLGATDGEVAAIDALLDGTMHPERLASVLRAHGVEVEETEPTGAYGQALARDAVARLMAVDCGGRVGLRGSPAGLILDQDITCGTLVPGARITALGGHDLLVEGHLAYDYAREECAAARPVRVTQVAHGEPNERRVELACAETLPPRPAYVRISALPPTPERTSSSPKTP